MADSKQARLTDAQKKSNHIESERKRREAIREGFDRLADMVPGMTGQGRSEAVVLQGTVQYLMEQQIIREKIKSAAVAHGMSEREIEDIYQKEGDKSRAEAQTQAGSDSNSNSNSSTVMGSGTGGSSSGNGGPVYGTDSTTAIRGDDSNGPGVYDGSDHKANYPHPSQNHNQFPYSSGHFGGTGYNASA